MLPYIVLALHRRFYDLQCKSRRRLSAQGAAFVHNLFGGSLTAIGRGTDNGAQPWEKEKDAYKDLLHTAELTLTRQGEKWCFESNLSELLPDHGAGMVSSDTLGEAFEPEQRFENPDGSPIRFDTDFFGRPVDEDPLPGPFADKDSWTETHLF